MKGSCLIAAAASVFLASCAAQPAARLEPASLARSLGAPHAFPVTPLNVPSSQFPTAVTTAPTGIRGILVTATVALQDGFTVGALYDTSNKTWKQFTYPRATSTAVYGPDLYGTSYRLVGSYKNAGEANDHGFIYDGVTKTYATIDAPAALCAPKACNETIAHSGYGDASYVVVGNCDAVTAAAPGISFASLGHAFLYDGKTFRNIDVSGASGTTAYGVWVNGRTTAVAGGYADAKGVHAYVRDLASPGTPVIYDYPGAKITHFEGIAGSPAGSGNYTVVGDYTDAKDGAVYGFYLQILNWKAGTPINVGKLSANSVWSRTVVGVTTEGGSESGYIVELPVVDPP
jgi:hypothetical protein